MMGVPRDDFALFTGLAYTGLGAVLVIDASGLRELGEVWYAPPAGSFWESLLTGQESALFAGSVLAIGLLFLALWAGWQPPLAVRVVVPWMGWVLAINLTALRLVGFVGTGNPPWWATILLTVFTVVVTKRRLTGLRLGHHDA